jgi:hypothetical protein
MKGREQFYANEYFIHDLTSERIAVILQSSAWTTAQQEISSAETNNDCCPEPNLKNLAAGENTCGVDAFVDLEFGADVNMILDVGGGKFDVCRDYLQKRGIDLLVYDPYNRTQEHNEKIKWMVANQKVAAATSMSVLNVVAEPEARLAHICTLKDALQINGMAYFKMWPGEGELKGCYQPTVNSYGHPGFQANAYADRFLREVQLVFGVENAMLHAAIPNLIVAKKITDEPTDKNEIECIQRLSKSDAWYVRRQQAMKKHDVRLFSSQHRNGECSAAHNSMLNHHEM